MISRLKSLELHGYKTFANRTVFEFPGAVTAIVGPNGSGKSNITDALRWVLGEQSYSLLRGKKTEDMIFAGSDRRTRSGMATATVILDNSDNWLPIDYSEVSIARRAYRDGSNEYLLNGQKVRLRDVSELLAESGLAERTYTIIGQGLVDAALALRAEDRRRLFEEAAGIGLHRTRRQEAIRRLEDTQRNLERVKDILHELRPRLRSLERQAKRAIEYDQAVVDLKVLLREWYGYHWHRAQDELSEAQTLASEQSNSLENTRQKEEALDAEIGKLRDRRGELRSTLNGLHRQSADLHLEREKISRDLAVSEERARNLEDQSQKLNADLSQIIEELSTLEERQKFALEEEQKLSIELEEAQANKDGVQAEYDKKLLERKQLESALNSKRQELVNLSTLRDELNTRRAEYQIQINSLANSQIRAEKENEEAQVELRKFESSVETISLQMEDIRQKKSDLENSQAQLRETYARKYSELQSQEKILVEHEAELVKLNTQADVLEQAAREFSGYSEGAKILLETFKQKDKNGARGLLGDNIQVAQEYEIAIGAALEDYIDAILLEGRDDVIQALHRLRESSEKGALLPLDDLYLPKQKNEYRDPVRSGKRAVELVQAPIGLQSVLEILLGNTWVVEDEKEAQKVLAGMRTDTNFALYASAKIVTLQGEVFYATGQIRTKPGAPPASLSRPRQQKDLLEKIAAVNNQLSQSQKIALDLENELETIDSREKSAAALLQAEMLKYEEVIAAHSQENIALEKIERDSKWRAEQILSITEDLTKYQGNIDELNGELALLDEKIKEAQNLVLQDEENLSNLLIDNVQKDLSHWGTRLEILRQGLQAASARRVERTQMLEAAQKRKQGIDNNLQEVGNTRQELKLHVESLNNKNQQIAMEIEAAAQKINPSETALQEIETKLSEYLRVESKERILISQAEQSFTQARINQIRKQEALDSLRRQIESDFGLVAFEYHDDVSGPTPLPFAGIVEDLPLRQTLPPELEDSLKRQRALLRRIGPINPEAKAEYDDVSERYNFLTEQVGDLNQASDDVQRVIAELDEIMQREFCNTFEAVADEFSQIFGRLFGGGSARLILTDPDDLNNTGIDIEARLPGKREQGLSLLSGGERSLTAVALVFSLLRVSPTPFCVLDEVDAMLDEANVGRFRDLLRELSNTTQFIMITHNRATVQVADIIYGVTMGRDSTSQILSLKVDELEQVIN